MATTNQQIDDTITVSDQETEQTINVIDNLNAENLATEKERDAAVAEVASLKRKYEPVSGILMKKMLRLNSDHGTTFMSVLVYSGEYLQLELVPRVPNNGYIPNFTFRPHIEGTKDNMEDFGSFGNYEIYIGNGDVGYICLVHFDKTCVSITNHHGTDEPLIIDDVTCEPTVTMIV